MPDISLIQVVMTYEDHLRAALAAFAEARPDVSDRKLSLAAGLNSGWVSDFRATGRATLLRAQRILDAMRNMCPPGAEGAALREVLDRLQPAPDGEAAA